jgi:hypothetical protein
MDISSELQRIMAMESYMRRNAVQDFLSSRIFWKKLDHNSRVYIRSMIPDLVYVLFQCKTKEDKLVIIDRLLTWL